MNVHLVLTAELVPQPARNFMRLWGLDRDSAADRGTLNKWCLTGKVPGAYKGPDGAWWINPLLMLTWGDGDGQPEGIRLHRAAKKGA